MLDCKLQILSSIPNNTCCSHAFFNTFVTLAGQIDTDKNTILINTKPEYQQKLTDIVLNFCPNTTINAWDNYLSLSGNVFDIISTFDLNSTHTLDLSLFLNDCDKLTALKSAFVACGNLFYVSDSNQNSKGYRLDFSSFYDLKSIQALLLSYNFAFNKTKRKSNNVLYTKNSNTICDFLVLIGASYASLDIQNNLAIREVRNSANRQNNCFESNLDKTINASSEQLKAINYIFDQQLLESLDENLKDIALLRLANPDATLNELRTALGNKISRAGIKYRLDKIIEFYKKHSGERL